MAIIPDNHGSINKSMDSIIKSTKPDMSLNQPRGNNYITLQMGKFQLSELHTLKSSANRGMKEAFKFDRPRNNYSFWTNISIRRLGLCFSRGPIPRYKDNFIFLYILFWEIVISDWILLQALTTNINFIPLYYVRLKQGRKNRFERARSCNSKVIWK